MRLRTMQLDISQFGATEVEVVDTIPNHTSLTFSLP